MTIFYKTRWEKVKVGDTVLIVSAGKIFEVEIEERDLQSSHVIVTYKYKNGRSYRFQKYLLTETVYVQSQA